MPIARTGGQILVDSLQIQGADMAFGVPGESYLAVLDALHDSPIRFIINRQEAGAAFMAEAYGKLTGKPGICFVTRGPGATNASIGIHTAQQDSTPLIVFIGQVGNDFVEREAFQEIDYRRMFGQVCKWVTQIDRAERIPEYVARAFQVATSGRPGPVVLALPEDMLTSLATVEDTKRHHPVHAAPTIDQITQLRTRLANAARPLVLLGGSGWDHAACNAIQCFVERNHLPVACVFRRQDLFDNAHPNYIGDVGIGINPALAKRINDADLILAIGARLGEMTTGGYQLLQAPRPLQQLIHIHADAQELGRVYQADLMINSGIQNIAEALKTMMPVERSAAEQQRDQVAQARAAYLAWQAEPALFTDKSIALNLWRVMQILREKFPPTTILTNGAGNFATWGHRFWQYGNRDAALRTQLAPTSGAMGYGVPAGIAAALLGAQRGNAQPVVTLSGDGDFMMNGQELATAVQYGAKVLFIVFNNRMFGTIRMHQERNYPARISGTELHNPDFAALARAYGAFGESVEHTEEFATVLQHALRYLHENAGPALIELRYDGNIITPSATLTDIRKSAFAAAIK